jgi:voltage-gated potassium channel
MTFDYRHGCCGAPPPLFTVTGRSVILRRMTTAISRVDRFERRTEGPLAVLALVFLAAYAWPILQPNISPSWKHVCTVTDYVIWVVFVVEFVARVVLAERRGQYVVRHVPDVLMVALPVLRPLRLLRFLVLLRMINRRATASLDGRIVAYVVASAGLVLLISALAMLEAERHDPQANIRTFGDALWWALSTMSTVGYGDRVPTTGGGRVIGAGLMLAGIALLGVITATFASWLIAQVRETETEAQTATRGDIAELRAEIARLTRTVAQREAESAS